MPLLMPCQFCHSSVASVCSQLHNARQPWLVVPVLLEFPSACRFFYKSQFSLTSYGGDRSLDNVLNYTSLIIDG